MSKPSESGLTVEKLLDACEVLHSAPRARYPARIFPCAYWPQELVGYWIRPLEAPPWFARILRFFRISPHIMWLKEPMLRDVGPVQFPNGDIFCSRAQYEMIKAATQPATSMEPANNVFPIRDP